MPWPRRSEPVTAQTCVESCAMVLAIEATSRQLQRQIFVVEKCACPAVSVHMAVNTHSAATTSEAANLEGHFAASEADTATTKLLALLHEYMFTPVRNRTRGFDVISRFSQC